MRYYKLITRYPMSSSHKRIMEAVEQKYGQVIVHSSVTKHDRYVTEPVDGNSISFEASEIEYSSAFWERCNKEGKRYYTTITKNGESIDIFSGTCYWIVSNTSVIQFQMLYEDAKFFLREDLFFTSEEAQEYYTKLRKPPITLATRDGEQVLEGNKLWGIHKDVSEVVRPVETTLSEQTLKETDFYWFSTEYAATDYWLKNCTNLSISDVTGAFYISTYQVDLLKNIVAKKAEMKRGKTQK